MFGGRLPRSFVRLAPKATASPCLRPNFTYLEFKLSHCKQIFKLCITFSFVFNELIS